MSESPRSETVKSDKISATDSEKRLFGEQSRSYAGGMINLFVRKHIAVIEMIGVVMRIASFSLVSWLGPNSPFMFVWVFNTIDAVALTWCAVLKKDRAYTLLNAFWVIIGVVGIARASGLMS